MKTIKTIFLFSFFLCSGIFAKNEKGLILYLPFDGNTEPLEKSEIEIKPGGEISYIDGYNKKAIYFKNEKSSLRYSGLDLPKEKGTFMCWFRPDWKEKTPPGNFVFYRTLGKEGKTYLDTYRAGDEKNTFFQFRIYNQEWLIKVNKQIKDIKESGRWYHYALVWESSGYAVIYINGEPMAKVESAWETPADPVNILLIELSRGSSGCALDEYKVYNRALSADEIRAASAESGSAGISRQQVFPAPLLQASFDDTAELLNKGEPVKGKINVRMSYRAGISGNGIVVKRYAYDQKSSLSYSGINPFADNSTINFTFIPDWNGNDGKHYELLHFISSTWNINFEKTADNQLALKAGLPGQKEAISIPCVFEKNKQYVITLRWDTAGSLELSVNGSVSRASLANKPKGLDMVKGELWIGSAEHDNLKGDTAEGLFDELKIYGSFLSDDDIKKIAAGSGGSDSHAVIEALPVSTIVQAFSPLFPASLGSALCAYFNQGRENAFPFSMAKIPQRKILHKTVTVQKHGAINFWFRVNDSIPADRWTGIIEYTGQQTGCVFSFNKASGKLTALVKGKNTITFQSKRTEIFPGEWHMASLIWNKGKAEYYIDATLQAWADMPEDSLLLPKNISINTACADMDEFSAYNAALSRNDLIALFNCGLGNQQANTEIKTVEKDIWSLTDAEQLKSSTRSACCLHGMWRLSYGMNNLLLPPDYSEQFYAKVPGRWLSYYYYNIFRDKNNSFVELPVDKKKLENAFHGWYSRIVEIPQAWKGKKMLLTIGYGGAPGMRVYVNNQLVETASYKGANANGVMETISCDLSGFSGQEKIKLDIYLYFEKYNIHADTQGLSLDNVFLHRLDNLTAVKDVLILPSVRNKNLTIDADIYNFSKETGQLAVQADIIDPQTGKSAVRSAPSVITLKGEPLENCRFSFPWANAELWDMYNPRLYECKVRLYKNSAVIDENYGDKFGFREFRIEKGDFYLNDKKIHLIYHSSGHGEVCHRYQYLNMRNTEVENTMKTVKSLGFNLIGLAVKWYYNDETHYHANSPTYILPALDAGDRIGMYYMVWVPYFNELMDKNIYDEELRSHIRAVGNHPSVLLYLPTFNTCGYPFAMHPTSTSDMTYDPPSRKKERREALYSDSRITDLDPTRQIFHNYSGNLYKIYTSMHYMSFGVPLQEREDWPSHWAKTKKIAFMPSEFGFPYNAQFLDFDAPNDRGNGKILMTENCARFFGEEAYALSVKPAARVGEKFSYTCFDENFREGTVLDPLFLKTKTLVASSMLKSWRSYGVSGIGVFAEEHTAFSQTTKQYTITDVSYSNIKTRGLMPDKITVPNRVHHLDQPTAYADVLKKYQAPLLYYIAGPKDDFNNKDHAYYSGEAISKQIMIINDLMQPVQAEVIIRLAETLSGKVIQQVKGSPSADPGEVKGIPFSFPAPAVKERGDFELRLEILINGKKFAEDIFALQVFSPVVKPSVNAQTALYDPKGKTEAMLKKAGVVFRKVTAVSELTGVSRLIIGREAIGIVPDRFLADLEQKGLIKKGLDLLIFEQQPCNFANLIFENESQRYVFITDREHPILSGLSDPDFINWRGASDMIDAYPPPDPLMTSSPHYPFVKWKWGNNGIAATTVVRKTGAGSLRPILSCGFDMMNTPLFEMEKNGCRILICQMDITSRYGTDPAATLLANNLLAFFSSRQESKPADAKTALFCSDEYADFFENDLLLAAERNPSSLVGCSAAIIAGVKPDNAALKKIQDFADQGGIVFCIGGRANADIFSALPFTGAVEPVSAFRLLVKNRNALLRGLGNSDFYFRDVKDMNIFPQLAGNSLLDQPVLCAVKKGRGMYILAGFDHNTLKEKPVVLPGNKEYYSFIDTYIRQKVYRIFSVMLGNAGASFNMPALFTGSLYQNSWNSTDEVFIDLNGQWKFSLDADNKGEKLGWQKKDFSDANWAIVESGLEWEKQGYTNELPFDYGNDSPNFKPGGKNHTPYDGYAWYRREIIIPEQFRDCDITLFFNRVDDCDWTYFNGTQAGFTDQNTHEFWNAKRIYKLPASLINFSGKNTIAVKVLDIHGGGGLSGLPIQLEFRKKNSASAKPVTMYINNLPKYDVNAYHMW